MSYSEINELIETNKNELNESNNNNKSNETKSDLDSNESNNDSNEEIVIEFDDDDVTIDHSVDKMIETEVTVEINENM